MHSRLNALQSRTEISKCFNLWAPWKSENVQLRDLWISARASDSLILLVFFLTFWFLPLGTRLRGYTQQGSEKGASDSEKGFAEGSRKGS